MIHDSHLFDGVDGRQVISALKIGAETAEELGFQYIVTMNEDDAFKENIEGFDLGVVSGLHSSGTTVKWVSPSMKQLTRNTCQFKKREKTMCKKCTLVKVSLCAPHFQSKESSREY